jgi:hypothetical protein
MLSNKAAKCATFPAIIKEELLSSEMTTLDDSISSDDSISPDDSISSDDSISPDENIFHRMINQPVDKIP